MPTYKSLNRYSMCLIRKPTQFPCPQCGMYVLPKQYENHCNRQHNFNARIKCVWCFGKESWKSGQKNDRVDHLLQCWRKFMVLHTRRPPISNTIIPFDLTPMCEPRNFFNHYKIPDLPQRAYHPVWPMPLNPMIQIFNDPHLNLGATYVKRYLKPGNLVWHHAMVRAVAFQSFLDAMDTDEGRTQTLVYFSWCNGGVHRLPKHRQHVHFILVATKEFMENLWKKINTTDRPCRNFKCIRSKRIVSAMHLVNTIGYLSQRKSRCNFTFDGENTKENLNHFYIYSPLPADYRLALVTQWDGGIMELIHQEYRHMDPNKLLHVPMTFSQGKWQIQVKHLPGIRLNLALPISEHLQLSTEPTPIYLHLAHGKKLYFTEATETSEAAQALFYSVVGEEWWTPCPYQQKCLRTMKPTFDRIAELETENASLVRKVDSLETRMGEMELENASLKRKVADFQDEIGSLLRKMNLMNEEEIGRLRTKVQRLETENGELKTENKKLKTENGEMNQKLKHVG